MALNAGHAAILGIVVCWLGLFLPGILMIYAVLPWWGAFRNLAVYRRCGHPSKFELLCGNLRLRDLSWRLPLHSACSPVALLQSAVDQVVDKGAPGVRQKVRRFLTSQADLHAVRRMLPGLNAAAVGLITAAVFQLSFSVRANSPTPVASTCIGALSLRSLCHSRLVLAGCSSPTSCCAEASAVLASVQPASSARSL